MDEQQSQKTGVRSEAQKLNRERDTPTDRDTALDHLAETKKE
jgi:hypothetical protein